MSSSYAFVNDRFLPQREATLSVSDLGISRGYGIFDFFKTIGDTPIFLQDHLDRFFGSAERMYLPVPFNRQRLEGIIRELIDKNKLGNSGIRLLLTGGESPDAYSIVRPNFVVTQQAIVLPPVLQRPIGLSSLDHQRQLPEVKTIDYLMAIHQQPLLKQNGTQDLLYRQGTSVRECPRANFFIVDQQGCLVTPGSRVLHGITRSKIIGLAEKYMPVQERELTIGEVYLAREAFLTSTTKNILPVHEVDGNPIGTGEAGPVTQRLFEELSALLNGQIRNG